MHTLNQQPNMIAKLFLSSLLGLVLVCLSSCLEEQIIVVNRIVPGAIALPGVHTIAMAEITGASGEMLGGYIQDQLMWDGPWTWLNRDYVHQILAENNLWRSNVNQAIDVGNLINADAIVVGTMTADSIDEDMAWELRYSANGQPYTLYSRTGLVNFAVRLQVIDTHQGIVLGAATLDASRILNTDYQTIDDMPNGDPAYLMQVFPPLDERFLLQTSLQQLAQQFAGLVLPQREVTRVTIFADRQLFDSQIAVAALERGDFAKAIDLYSRALWAMDSSVPSISRAKICYNLAVALGSDGNFSEAIAMVEEALRLYPMSVFKQYMRQLYAYQSQAASRF